jgi:GTP-binding protein
MHLNQAYFVHSAANKRQLLPDGGVEVAFIGRSNAGKSSAINCITGVNQLAHSSKTPGRTQLINFFQVEQGYYLVDLPGYGYAKVAHTVKERIQHLLNDYLEARQSLRAIILIMDSRHPLQDSDQEMVKWCSRQTLPIHILLTKADKLSRNQAMQAMQETQKYCQRYTASSPISIQIFSATTGMGIDEARDYILKSFYV